MSHVLPPVQVADGRLPTSKKKRRRETPAVVLFVSFPQLFLTLLGEGRTPVGVSRQIFTGSDCTCQAQILVTAGWGSITRPLGFEQLAYCLDIPNGYRNSYQVCVHRTFQRFHGGIPSNIFTCDQN